MPVLRLPLLPAAAGKQHWGNLPGAALSLAIAEAASAAKRFTLLLTADSQSAERLEQELSFFAPDLPVLHFPDWETLPYDHFSPHQDIISSRLSALYQIPRLRQGAVITSISTLMQRLCPQEYLDSNVFLLQQGDQLQIDATRQQLEKAGYRCVNQVREHGEFAVRGSIIDLFPMGSANPFRIELFDDEIDTIRTFDAETQRTINKLSAINLMPAREFPFDEEAIVLFRQQWRSEFTGNPAQCAIYQDVSQAVCPAGIEYYLPLFFDQTATLFDYLSADTLIVCVGEVFASAKNFWQEIKQRYEERRYDKTHPLLPPEQVFIPEEQLLKYLGSYPRIEVLVESLTPAPLPLTGEGS